MQRTTLSVSWLGHLAALAAGYFVLAAGATAMFGSNPAVRLANAVALAFVAREALARWPILLVVVFLSGVAAREFTDTALAIGANLCNVFEVAMAAFVVRRGGGLGTPWYARRAIPSLLAAWLLVPAISSGIGAALLRPGSGQEFLAAWRTWYGASALGLVIATPLLLSWFDPEIRQRAIAALRQRRALLLLPGMALCAAAVVQDALPPLMFLTFPIALYLTAQSGLAGATAALLAVMVAGSWATLQEAGAIVAMTAQASDVPHRMQALQLYVASLVASSLPFAALLVRQRRLLDDVQRVDQARSEFLSAMSHEIRTPLTGMLGMIDLLAAEELSAKQRRFVESLRGSGRHLLSVVNDILDFSRIESGRLELETIDFSLPDVVERVQSLLHPSAAERGLQLNVQVDPHSPPVLRGDPTRIHQVLLNLTGNAIKFTPSGHVTLRVTSDKEGSDRLRVRFEVSDTGVGIAADKLEFLFAPFTQADRTISRQYGGSGLGLAISKRLADAMGGTIRATSRPGVGSVFTFEVPLAVGDASQLVQAAAARTVPMEPRRILVAEDVEVNREILRAALSRHGHELTFATNGAEAIECLQRGAFDLVLMDVQMPRMDGVEATRRIRAMAPPLSEIPIIGLTANVMASEQARYLAAGMNDCLMKPIDWDRLTAVLWRYGGGGDSTMPAALDVLPPLPLPPPMPPEEPPAVPEAIIDDARLDGLRAIADPAELAQLVGLALAAATDTAARIVAAPDLAALAMEAHKLKGSAGTVGFETLAAAALRIEDAARAGIRDGDSIATLGRILEATRRVLVARGILPAPG